MFKINFIILLILNVSFCYSQVIITKETEVKFYCNATLSTVSEIQIHKLFQNLSVSVTKLSFACGTKVKMKLNPDLFPKNLSIEYLYFNGFFMNILPNSFRNLKSLKYLGFNNCSFNDFLVNPFGELYQLLFLDLSSNSITIFNSFLIPPSNLNYLNLTNNNISFLSKDVYNQLSKSIKKIEIHNNIFQCHCINHWIYHRNFDTDSLLLDNSFEECNITLLKNCSESFLADEVNLKEKDVYAFQNVIIDCNIDLNTILPRFKYWISPNNEIFGLNSTNVKVLNNVKFTIQPLFIETIIHINHSTNALYIENFRGYFRGNWTCVVISSSGLLINKVINLIAKVHTKEMFDFSITIGFSFAGAWLLVAICVGLVQYCKETSCCRRQIDYNKSNLFERSYVQTVIPVPFVDSVSDSSSNDSETNCSQPLNHRTRYDSHNNDVQLIFKDQELADEYAQMLSQLKEASETGDEHFKDRLTTLRTRFSIDFNKMRFELKRGMEQLKSNSSAAAHKLRKSVGHMKDHMKSFSEFCGTSNMAQSISIVVISDNSNINNPTQSDCQEKHEKKVFRFFEPL